MLALHRSHPLPIAVCTAAIAALLIATAAPTPAAAADGVDVIGIEIDRCHPIAECIVPLVGTGLDAVTGVSTQPVREVTIASQSATRLELRFAAGQSDALVDLVLHTPGGELVLPRALVLGTGEGLYRPLPPTRIFDTRDANLGGPSPVPANGTVTVPYYETVNGIFPVKSYVVNVTVVAPGASGHLTVFPTERPLASNLNFAAGRTVANLVSVKAAPDKTFKVTNSSGRPAHVVVDLVGVNRAIFGDSAYGYVPLDPERAYDSRWDAPFRAGQPEDVQLGHLPAGTQAVAMNVTAVGASRGGHVTVFPATEPEVPRVSNLNVPSAAPIANMVIVETDSDGVISIDTSIPRVDLIFDVVGVYVGGELFLGPSLPFRDTAPTRIIDTRNGTGAPKGSLSRGKELVFDVGELGSVPDDAETLLINVTVTGATTAGYLSVWPGGLDRPVVSSLNFAVGQTVPNLVLVPIGADGTVRFFSSAGSAHVIADLAGYHAFSGGTPWPSEG